MMIKICATVGFLVINFTALAGDVIDHNEKIDKNEASKLFDLLEGKWEIRTQMTTEEQHDIDAAQEKISPFAFELRRMSSYLLQGYDPNLDEMLVYLYNDITNEIWYYSFRLIPIKAKEEGVHIVSRGKIVIGESGTRFTKVNAYPNAWTTNYVIKEDIVLVEQKFANYRTRWKKLKTTSE